jgi:signal transduction histidine kinase
MVRVSAQGLGARLSGRRRHRVAYLALLRRSSRYVMRTWLLRVVALTVIAGLSVMSARSALAIALCLVASLGTGLLWVNLQHTRRQTEPRFWLPRAYRRNLARTDGRHRLSLGSYIEIPESFVLIAIPSWVATDDPLWARLIMLAAAVGFFVSVAGLIFADHAWFNPAETDPPAWHEIFRLLAGPITAGLVCLITLPADWGPEGRWAALAISLIPLIVNLRLSDTDLIMGVLPGLVQEESHAGRELVINETHGALSTNLRLLEQQARELRSIAPALHDLAVSANSRLRETLTLARLGSESSTSVQSLDAPVLTLARAVGARASVEVTVDRLGPEDQDLARLVLNDLVGNALNAGAGDVRVTIAPDGPRIAVSVTDDAPPMAPGVWKTPGTSSARLEAKLAELSGTLTAAQHNGTKIVTACWAVRAGRVGGD